MSKIICISREYKEKAYSVENEGRGTTIHRLREKNSRI